LPFTFSLIPSQISLIIIPMKFDRKGLSKTIYFFILVSFLMIPRSIFSVDFQKVKENIIKNSWKRVGFVYIDPSLLLKDVGYNSNIYYYDEEASPDWTADAGLLINFSTLIGKRFILVVKESPYYSFYLENKDLQYFNNDLSAYVYTYLGRFNLKYIYNVSNMLSRPTVEFGNRIKTIRYRNELSIDYGNYNRFFIEVSVGTEDLSYDDSGYSDNYDFSSRMNRKRSTAVLTINKVIFTRTLFFLKSEYYDLRFESDVQRNGTGGIFSAGIKFPEVSILKGQFQIGVKYFTPEDPVVAKYSKPNGSGNISFRLTKRFNLGLSYTIDNMYSYFEPDQYFDLRRYTVGLDYYIGRNIKAGYRFSSGETIYKKISGEETGRNDQTEQSDFRLGIRISGNMEFGIQYTRYTGRSSFLEFTRNYNFIGGYINHEF